MVSVFIMATLKFYLDTRASKGDECVAAPLKLAVVHRGSTSYINLNVSLCPGQWDASRQLVCRHPMARSLSAMLQQRMVESQGALYVVARDVDLRSLSASQLKCLINQVMKLPLRSASVSAPNYMQEAASMNVVGNMQAAAHSAADNSVTGVPSFLSVFDENMSLKSEGNRRVIASTRSRLVAWLGEEALSRLRLEDITAKWVKDFERFLMSTCKSANTRGIHLRNIRAALNYAIDNEWLKHYVFRKISIPKQATRKRNLKVSALRRVFFADGLDDWMLRYRDLFVLTFLLRGINFVDLCYLDEIRDGRIEYVRRKTHKPYSIKVEPEMLAIIEKYRGEAYLLNYMDKVAAYRSFYNTACNGLRAVRERLNSLPHSPQDTLTGLTTYWARHSWATIAASIGVPFEVIRAGLGHGGNTVTDIYIERDISQVDAANRRIIDYVYNLRPVSEHEVDDTAIEKLVRESM